MKKIKNILRKNRKIKSKSLYAVTAGDYIGKFLLFITPEPVNGKYDCLAIGQGRDISSDGFEAVSIPEKDVRNGLKHKILDYVVALPKDETYNVLYKEWQSRKGKLNEEFNN